MVKLKSTRSHLKGFSWLLFAALNILKTIFSSIFLVSLLAYVLLYSFYFMVKASFLMIVSILRQKTFTWGGPRQQGQKKLIMSGQS